MISLNVLLVSMAAESQQCNKSNLDSLRRRKPLAGNSGMTEFFHRVGVNVKVMRAHLVNPRRQKGNSSGNCQCKCYGGISKPS